MGQCFLFPTINHHPQPNERTTRNMATKHQFAGPECPIDSMPEAVSNQFQNGERINVRIRVSGRARTAIKLNAMTCFMLPNVQLSDPAHEGA